MFLSSICFFFRQSKALPLVVCQHSRIDYIDVFRSLLFQILSTISICSVPLSTFSLYSFSIVINVLPFTLSVLLSMVSLSIFSILQLMRSLLLLSVLPSVFFMIYTFSSVVIVFAIYNFYYANNNCIVYIVTYMYSYTCPACWASVLAWHCIDSLNCIPLLSCTPCSTCGRRHRCTTASGTC